MGAVGQVVDLNEYRDLRAVVDGCVRAYLKNGTAQARVAMEQAVTAVMRKYGLREMRFPTYIVRLETYDRTVPIIIARCILPGCPKCGRKEIKDGLHYLRTQKQNLFGTRDLWIYACMECGEIFARWDPNERSVGPDAG